MKVQRSFIFLFASLLDVARPTQCFLSASSTRCWWLTTIASTRTPSHWSRGGDDDDDDDSVSPTTTVGMARNAKLKKKKSSSNGGAAITSGLKGFGSSSSSASASSFGKKIIDRSHSALKLNKKRREPAAYKKRRLYARYEEMKARSKRDRHVRRSEPVHSESRTKLPDLSPGDALRGRVISLTRFGAYVDVGTEVDGLLHVSQITREEFVDHPRKYLTPGEDVRVRVVRLDPQLRKLQLTMLPEDVFEEENVLNKNYYEASADDGEEIEDDRIQLDEIEIDDELWGEIRRVTDYGAYVELGAVVRGFLHFMDHPMFGEVKGSHPKEFMRIGDRVRVWVSDVDGTKRRIKLTANRPAGLPGPRREIQWI